MIKSSSKDNKNPLKPFTIFFVPLVLLLVVELGLSALQLMRWKAKIKPYHLTSALRPFVRFFVHDDFYPRTHQVKNIPWDYRTDRMIPGKYQQNNEQSDYSINSYGIRGKEFAIPKPDDVVRIVVLGSSTAFGTDVDDNATYPAVLERILNEQISHRRVEVLNYGFSGKSLYYNARHYFPEADRLDPDIVILNNIRNTWFYDQRQDISDYWDILVPQRYWVTKISHFLTDHVLICRLVRKNWQKYVQSKDMRTITVDSKLIVYNHRFFESLYYEVIHGIYQDAKVKRGASVIYVFEPTYLDPEIQSAYLGLSEEALIAKLNEGVDLKGDEANVIFSTLLYNNIRKLHSQYNDVIVLDPIQAFIQAQDKNPSNPVFIDHIHLTARGNEVLANMIASKLKDTGRFE